MKIITIEEHLAGAPINRYLAKYAAGDAPYTAMAHGKGRPYDADPELFGDLDKCRIEDMDKHGITMQILSCPAKSQLLPENEAPAIVSETNDYIAQVVKNILTDMGLLHFCRGLHQAKRQKKLSVSR